MGDMYYNIVKIVIKLFNFVIVYPKICINLKMEYITFSYESVWSRVDNFKTCWHIKSI